MSRGSRIGSCFIAIRDKFALDSIIEIFIYEKKIKIVLYGFRKSVYPSNPESEHRSDAVYRLRQPIYTEKIR